MKVLIVGNTSGAGGREHAIGAAVAASPDVTEVYFTPGNGGTAAVGTTLSITQEEVPAWAAENKIDLVIIGPEAPLVAGLADALRKKGLRVCGPGAAAARLEGSKAFAYEFMEQHGIAQAPSQIVKNTEEGLAAIEAIGGPDCAVIKADGLASGKGVFLPDSAEAAKSALDRIFAGEVDGSGSQTIIQKRYSGPEASVFVLSDGEEFYIIPVAAQDHKRLMDGDKGPNTGGMGAYAPIPKNILSGAAWSDVRDIAKKTIDGMKAAGTPYQGILYIGLMMADETDGKPIVIEYNVRFGDPEAQVLIPLLQRAGVDIYRLLYATAEASGLSDIALPEKLSEAAMSAVMAAHNYPESPRKGDIIYGLDKNYKNVSVYHAGTKVEAGKIIASGGRVLNVTGFGTTITEAANAAYAAIGDDAIHFADMQYRTDIGYQAR